MKSQIPNPDKARPILEDERFAIVRVVSAIRAIPGLNIPSRPAAIGWIVLLAAFIAFAACVTSKRVDSVQAVLRTWGQPKNVEESINRFSKFGTDIPASRTIEAVVVVSGAVASLEHVSPHGILSGSGLAMNHPGRASAHFKALSAIQMVASNESLLPANTAASPVRLAEFGLKTKDSETAESLAGNVAKCTHCVSLHVLKSHTAFYAYLAKGNWGHEAFAI